MEYSVETATTAAVVARVKHLRKRVRRLSGSELAAAMAERGFRWNQSTVAKLEAGRRRSVSVDELLALAEVLHVPVTALLVDERDERMRLADGHEYLPADVLLWLTADRALPGAPDYERVVIPLNIVMDHGQWADAARPARLARDQLKAIDDALGAREGLLMATERNYQPAIGSAENTYSSRLRDLLVVMESMRAVGMVPLPVDDRLQYDAKQRGIDLAIGVSSGQKG